MYVNEYEWQADLYKVFAGAHDGHFIYYPDVFTTFAYRRTVSLISISEDGSSPPVIKVYGELNGSLFYLLPT